MAQIDILKEILDYSLRKFNYEIIGANIYYLFNNERYAKAELKRLPNKNEFNGVNVTYISKLHGVIDSCDIYFKDVFLDQKRASVNVNLMTDEYDWFEQKRPTQRDLYRLALHIERYISIIGDFGSRTTDYLNLSVLASQAACIELAEEAGRAEPGSELLSRGGEFYLEQNDEAPFESASPEVNQPILEGAPAQANQPIHESTSAEVNHPRPEGVPAEVNRPMEVDSMAEEDNSKEENNIILGPAIQTSQPEVTVEEFVVEKPVEAEVEVEPEIEAEAEPRAARAEVPTEKAPARKHRFSFLWNREGREPEVVDFKETEFSALSPEPAAPGGSSPFISWSIGTGQNNIVASLYETERNTYRLRIYGSGRMQDFKLVPWSKYADHITELIIEDGIVNIGRNAFKSLSILKSVKLPDSIAEIGFSAFEFCSQLRDVKWPGRLRVIGSFAFSGTESLKNVKLPDSVTEIRDYAFDCTDGFTITHADPSRLTLGAGLHSSDFARDQSAHREKISINSYIGEDN